MTVMTLPIRESQFRSVQAVLVASGAIVVPLLPVVDLGSEGNSVPLANDAVREAISVRAIHNAAAGID